MKKTNLCILAASALLALCACGATPSVTSSPVASSEGASSASSVESISSQESSEESTLSSEQSIESSEDPIPSSEQSSESSEEPAPSSEQSSESSEDSVPSSEQSVESSEESSESSEEPPAVIPNIEVKADETIFEVTLYNAQGEEIVRANYGDWVYVGIKILNDDYGVASVRLSYGPTSKTLTKSTEAGKENCYAFSMPDVDEGEKATITIASKSMTAFKGYSFVGEYLGIQMGTYATRDVNEFNRQANVSINAAGEVTYGSQEAQQIATATDFNEGVADWSGGGFEYGSNFIAFTNQNSVPHSVFYQNSSSEMATDVMFGVKKQNADDSSYLYAVAAETVKIGGYRRCIVTVTREGAEYASVYVDFAKKSIYYDVSVKMFHGTSVTDVDAIYEVHDKDGALLAAYGAENEGGAAHRVEITSPYGTYENADGATIEFTGTGTATYDGETFDVALNGTEATLENNTRKVVVTIDIEAASFTLVSDETKSTEEKPAFMGHSYKANGTCWDGDSFTATLEFDAEAKTLCSSIGSYIRYMSNNTNAYGAPIPAEYDYDPATGVLKVTLVDCQTKGGKEMVMTYSALNDTFTVNTDWNSYYTTKNMVYKLVA